MSTLVMVVGLNPLRILRAVAALQPDLVVALTTPQTEYPVAALAEASHALGLRARFISVPGDAFLFEANRRALLAACHGVPGTVHWVVAGGTKPMIAAQCIVASETGGRVWTLDDRGAALVAADHSRQAIPEPAENLHPSLLARLHAGLRCTPVPDARLAQSQAGALADIRWLRARLGGDDHFRTGDVRAEVSLRAEVAVLELIRAVIPPNYSVHPGQLVALRDPFNPDQPAMEQYRGRSHARTFEVDGLVVRGLTAWVMETKFRNLKPQQARIAAAELDARRRDLAGDMSHGLLVVLNAGKSAPVADQVWEYEYGDTRVVLRADLLEAADAVLTRQDTAGTRLAQHFSSG